MRIWPFLCLLLFSLAACGPKEIGQGTSSEAPTRHEATAADQMRYPLYGAGKTEQMLYYYNQPAVMERMQDARISAFQRKMGIHPEDPAYRAIPKQRSPFRQ